MSRNESKVVASTRWVRKARCARHANKNTAFLPPGDLPMPRLVRNLFITAVFPKHFCLAIVMPAKALTPVNLCLVSPQQANVGMQQKILPLPANGSGSTSKLRRSLGYTPPIASLAWERNRKWCQSHSPFAVDWT